MWISHQVYIIHHSSGKTGSAFSTTLTRHDGVEGMQRERGPASLNKTWHALEHGTRAKRGHEVEIA